MSSVHTNQWIIFNRNPISLYIYISLSFQSICINTFVSTLMSKGNEIPGKSWNVSELIPNMEDMRSAFKE